ncbi:hypothetical protein ABZ214_27145 [Streptomyces iakyrus]|uniref:hypothetical protein n=1 Tax=Streptomyces iakyrus TaxID=68219 RepID=UPI00339EAF81
MHVPGLLQTEEDARAVFIAVLPRLSRLEDEGLRAWAAIHRRGVPAHHIPCPPGPDG